MASNILQKRVAESAIELVLNSVITRINARDDAVCSISVENVVTGELRIIETEGVFVFVGQFPNNKILPPGVILNKSGYAITDEKCSTGIPGIFVAGDLKEKYAKQIIVAAAEGCTAALAAASYIDEKKSQRE